VKKEVNREYLHYLFRTRPFLDLMDVYTTGEMSHRISETDLKNSQIPIPPLKIQNKIVENIMDKKHKADKLRKKAEEIEEEAKRELFDELSLITVSEKVKREHVFYKRT